MALFNHALKELTAKIVYYGPGLCGKTSNLKTLHDRLERGAGKLVSLSTAQDRTIYFDLLPIELGNIKGYTVRFQVCTVPGQVFYNETRKIVLRSKELWLHDNGDYGNVEHVADFVQEFLARWRPKEIWSMCWACTCSRPLLDAYDGGAVVVTSKKAFYINASTWAMKKVNAIKAKRKLLKPKGKRRG
jgi:hypothetical protein